ncbi:hypothetical protein [Paenibacillus ihbetae]|uniref:hypothetical protein n=1 Tax=Paenibacillus ihbetae TaxID=1870820 RepID=UPI001CB9CB57|nr:hypothetical protein [Paenibacillus ihbetae]
MKKMSLPNESSQTQNIHRLESELLKELNRYEQDEQAAILKKMISRLRKERYVRSSLQVVGEMVRTPFIWLLMSAGIALPLLVYALLVWVSLLVEG